MQQPRRSPFTRGQVMTVWLDHSEVDVGWWTRLHAEGWSHAQPPSLSDHNVQVMLHIQIHVHTPTVQLQLTEWNLNWTLQGMWEGKCPREGRYPTSYSGSIYWALLFFFYQDNYWFASTVDFCESSMISFKTTAGIRNQGQLRNLGSTCCHQAVSVLTPVLFIHLPVWLGSSAPAPCVVYLSTAEFTRPLSVCVFISLHY